MFACVQFTLTVEAQHTSPHTSPGQNSDLACVVFSQFFLTLIINLCLHLVSEQN